MQDIVHFDKVKEAKELAKLIQNDYLEALIDGFLYENDPEYRYVQYKVILKAADDIKRIWKL